MLRSTTLGRRRRDFLFMIKALLAVTGSIIASSAEPTGGAPQFKPFASEDAEQLLRSVSGAKLTIVDQGEGPGWLPAQAPDFVDRLKNGNGEYASIGTGVHLIHSFCNPLGHCGVFVADSNSRTINRVAWGYGMEIGAGDTGVLPDGTAWIVARYQGSYGGAYVSGAYLITYDSGQDQPKVWSIPLGAERLGFFDPEDADRLDETRRYCGDGESRLSGTAGQVGRHEWTDADRDGQPELLVHITRFDCNALHAQAEEFLQVFGVSKGIARAKSRPPP